MIKTQKTILHNYFLKLLLVTQSRTILVMGILSKYFDSDEFN